MSPAPRRGPRIGFEGRVVLPAGPYGSWDEFGVSDPYVVRIEPYFYLYYTGLDRGSRQRLGVARSADGVHWEKLRSNPILEPGDPGSFDENGLGEPAVWQSHGFYWMLYTGRDSPRTAAWAWRALSTASTGASCRPSSRARKPGTPR